MTVATSCDLWSDHTGMTEGVQGDGAGSSSAWKGDVGDNKSCGDRVSPGVGGAGGSASRGFKAPTL